MSRIVLCVDDDPDDRELIRNAIFKVDPSYTVVYATNGKEALQYLSLQDGKDLPCLVILDINMPVMDGKQTLIELARLELRNNVGIKNRSSLAVGKDAFEPISDLDANAAVARGRQ